jgi:hypothetical protein
MLACAGMSGAEGNALVMKPSHFRKSARYLLDELREIAWLLSLTAALSIGGAGLGVGLALVADAQSVYATGP